eukprot:gene31594-6788_t
MFMPTWQFICWDVHRTWYIDCPEQPWPMAAGRMAKSPREGAHDTFVESYEKFKKVLEEAPPSNAKKGPNTTPQCCTGCFLAQLARNKVAAKPAQVGPSPPQPIPMAREAYCHPFRKHCVDDPKLESAAHALAICVVCNSGAKSVGVSEEDAWSCVTWDADAACFSYHGVSLDHPDSATKYIEAVAPIKELVESMGISLAHCCSACRIKAVDAAQVSIIVDSQTQFESQQSQQREVGSQCETSTGKQRTLAAIVDACVQSSGVHTHTRSREAAARKQSLLDELHAGQETIDQLRLDMSLASAQHNLGDQHVMRKNFQCPDLGLSPQLPRDPDEVLVPLGFT